MRALDPHTRRASLSSGVEAAHSAKNLTMIVMVKMSTIVMVKMCTIVMVKMSMITVMMGMFIMVKMFI